MEHWLKTRRRELGLTQDQLSTKLTVEGFNYSPAMISHWETRRYMMPLGPENEAFRACLARILRMSEAEILEAAGYPRTSTHSAIAERAASLIDRMPETKARAAIQFLETLLEA